MRIRSWLPQAGGARAAVDTSGPAAGRGAGGGRGLREGRGGPRHAGEPSLELERRELCAALDEELSRLPEEYRAPLVLCALQGLTHREAARALGCPAGSMSKKLARAQ